MGLVISHSSLHAPFPIYDFVVLKRLVEIDESQGVPYPLPRPERSMATDNVRGCKLAKLYATPHPQ